ncbi:MAG TPA: hypothetical protein VFK80_06330, partial [Limnochordia bacterium]|nr:hypothetical protein [Limnochordia bacterium]
MENWLVAGLLRELAERLRAKGELRYKVRAYLQAAALIQELDEPVRAWVASGRHHHAPGIGPAIARKLEDWAETGAIP